MKKDLELKINGLEKEIWSAQQTLEKAEGRLENLKAELAKLEEAEKKPVVYFRNSCPFISVGDSLICEMDNYKKYSDEYIEFVVRGHKYRCIKTYTSRNYRYPNLSGSSALTLTFNSEYIFESYDPICSKYVRFNHIDHIELLEGVSEYDKTNQKV